jgi:uncharacterized protein (TIGR02118 family)
MISVVILYPKADDSTFDMDYYTGKHMPLLAEALGDACKGWGVSGPAAKHHAVGWAMVESQEAFDAAMGQRGAEIIGDVPNYTNVRPEMIVGPVVV